MLIVFRFFFILSISILLNAPVFAQINSEQTAKTVEKKQSEDIQVSLPVKSKKPSTPESSDNDWVNILHDQISDSVYQSAFWFDSFFSVDDNGFKSPKTNARIRLGWLPKRTNLSEIETRFRIKLTLPNLQNRVDVIFSDDSDDNLSDLPLENVDSQQAFNKDSFSASVRYVNHKDVNKYTGTRIGFSAGDLFVRLRHNRRFSWHDVHGVKIEPALYYFVKDGLGARLLLEYNYQSNHDDQYRINYSIRASESFKGQEWRYGLYYLKQLDSQRAAALGLVTNGKHGSEQGSFVDKYKLSYRYRFNALKTWLFFEVEPFVEWGKENNFSTDPGVALRIEGFFQKK